MKIIYTRASGDIEVEDQDDRGKPIKVKLDGSKRADEAVEEAKVKIKAEKAKRRAR